MKSKPIKKELTVDQKINRRNFLSFGVFAAASGAAYGGWKWLYNSSKEAPAITGGAREPLRRALNKTELFFRNFFSNNNLVRTYPKEKAAKNVRVNSNIGMTGKFVADEWKLQVKKRSGEIID
ncbi:MAG TPA: molybdopterin-binding oxidoreductase, partial [Pedobacter sp.]